MKYIDVKWNHTHTSEPFRLVSELDDQSFETRKLEFFVDGRIGYASEAGKSEDTELGEVAVPSIEEINSDPQFEGIEITREAFEELWTNHTIGKWR